ncbi:MAG: family 1 glycosylhydrolase [Novosphingobium sp.]
MTADRRTFIAGATATAGAMAGGRAFALSGGAFPKRFLWGAATAGHQVEGNNLASDIWLLEHVKPTMFTEPSGDAVNSFALWPADLDIVRGLGLNAYRFSLEWARIEPEPGAFSLAMLNHYKRIVEGCHARGLTPLVSFNHFTVPRWFAARGGWTDPSSPELFARFCDRAARHLADGIGYATTLNEPNAVAIMADVFPPQFLDTVRAMNGAAARACNSDRFRNAMVPDPAEIGTLQPNLIAAHRAGKAAIKAARGALPVGVTLAISDDEAVGASTLRDAKRALFYAPWLEVAKADDFIGVQNYARARWDGKAMLPPPAGAALNAAGQEVYAPSLGNAVRYAHAATGVPVIVTEHGVNAEDDRIRAGFIPAALAGLRDAIAEGVPVLGYVHWSLLDNFEWIFGYKYRFGLCSVDRTSFQRTPKPSARILGGIARRNAL